jgi:hypothetical protein
VPPVHLAVAQLLSVDMAQSLSSGQFDSVAVFSSQLFLPDLAQWTEVLAAARINDG